MTAVPAVLLDNEVVKRQIVLSIVGSTYALQVSDDGCWLRTRSSGPVVVTVPAQVDTEFDAYTLVTIERAAAGLVSFVGAGGVTVHSATDLAISSQYGVVELKRVDVNEWTLVNVSADPPRILDVLYTFASQTFAANEVLWAQHVQQEYIIPTNFDGWQAHLLVAPTASFVVSFLVDNVSVGTVTFAIGATSGTFSTATTQDLNGHTLLIRAPVTPDATAAGLYITAVPV